MTTVKKFSLFDTLEYSRVNLDILTETYSDDFYGKYLIKWPEYCVSYVNGNNEIIGYLLGKVEGDEKNEDLHGHITAVTVSPLGRRQGIAKYFINFLEMISEKIHNAFYVDLFVRPSNVVAVKMY